MYEELLDSIHAWSCDSAIYKYDFCNDYNVGENSKSEFKIMPSSNIYILSSLSHHYVVQTNPLSNLWKY